MSPWVEVDPWDKIGVQDLRVDRGLHNGLSYLHLAQPSSVGCPKKSKLSSFGSAIEKDGSE